MLAPSNVMPTERAYATDPVRRWRLRVAAMMLISSNLCGGYLAVFPLLWLGTLLAQRVERHPHRAQAGRGAAHSRSTDCTWRKLVTLGRRMMPLAAPRY